MKTYARSVLTGALVACCVLTFSVGVMGPLLPPFAGAPDIVRRVQLDWPAKPALLLKNAQGSVTILTEATDKVSADAQIRGYQRREVDPDRLERFLARMMKADDAAEGLRLVAMPEDHPDRVEFVVDLTVTVPTGTNVTVESANGNVRVHPRCGNVNVSGRNTDIEVVDPDGDVSLRSVNGRINAIGMKRD